MRAVAIDLDGVLGDTRPLWRDWLEDAARRFHSIAPLDPGALPDDRGEAAAELDRWAEAGVGDWRAALARFAEDRAPVYLRPSAEVSAALARARGRRRAGSACSPMRPSRWRASRSRSSARRAGSKPSRRERARSSASVSVSGPRRSSSATPGEPRPTIQVVKESELGDRQLDALLERLDRLNAELRALNRRLDSGEHLAPIVHELGALNESLQALAYAALGQQGPQVRRRRTG